MSTIINGHNGPTYLSTILFDLDDTLLDSFDARVEALEKVFVQANIHHPTAPQFLRDLHGTQLQEALGQLGAMQAVESNLFEDYRRTYWTKKPGRIALYLGIKPMLEELCSCGVKLGIVTQKVRLFEIDGHSAGTLRELDELGITNLFSVIIGFEDVSRYKPDPDSINLALSRLGVHPGKTLVVGDSTADIEAARAAGCWSCYATWGIPVSEQRLESIQADLVAETPEALLELKLWEKRAV
ncbi:MAG: HAD-IA family hydrolase [Chloroflexota bacterium]